MREGVSSWLQLVFKNGSYVVLSVAYGWNWQVPFPVLVVHIEGSIDNSWCHIGCHIQVLIVYIGVRDERVFFSLSCE